LHTVELAAVRTVIEPLTGRETRMHLTVSPEFVKLLAKAKAGQSHVQPGATDEQVLAAALELLIGQQEKRRASVPPKVKREVMKCDEGKCTWPVASGGVCGSTVRLEVDHVVPHNLEAARSAYGDEVMDLFAPRNPVAREPCSVYCVDVAAERTAAASFVHRSASCASLHPSAMGVEMTRDMTASETGNGRLASRASDSRTFEGSGEKDAAVLRWSHRRR
jgi:hypothetical protein